MKILIIEDEAKIANSLKKGLQQESYAVDIALDGLTGYDMAGSENYDVILLDLMLPGMDGMQVCSKLRKEKVNTPILMLTAKAEIDNKVEGLNLGADDYLSKPFAFEELLARIKALSRRPSQSTGLVLTANNLSLDTVTYKVKRNGKSIKLSKKEFALLNYLLRNKGAIVTKNQIIQNVWNFDADVLPNTVEVYVGYLRNKIDKKFPNMKPMIKTLRGFGYRID
ncbi:response regulator transcription factor [Candidatus Woesebacteria bacterium]|nr:MAG: response regulator transcription factor [Candidatus Woesebacteria bacterium]